MHTAPSAASVDAIAAIVVAAIVVALSVSALSVLALSVLALSVLALSVLALLVPSVLGAVAIVRRAMPFAAARRAGGALALVAPLAGGPRAWAPRRGGPPARGAAGGRVRGPPLSARGTDLTGTLSASQRASLDAQLAAIEQRKGAQVAILMLPTTQPEPIEAYGIRVADAWKLGRGRERAQRDTGDPKAGAIDDGVLLIVAKDDRRVRIEVGYGLEGAIPDAVAKRIITESITPRFRSGDFAGGLEAAVADLARRIDGESLPEPWQAPRGDRDELEGGLLQVVLMAFVVGLLVSQAMGRFIGAVVGGGGAGVGATAALASSGLGAAVGLGVGVLILAIGGRRGGGPGGTLRRTGRRTIGHGPVIVPGPGWGGGGWGSGGGGGGGFGGGGGGFGGGGASGDW